MALPGFKDTLLPGQKGDVLELDELWSFVEKKTHGCWLTKAGGHTNVAAMGVSGRKASDSTGS